MSEKQYFPTALSHFHCHEIRRNCISLHFVNAISDKCFAQLSNVRYNRNRSGVPTHLHLDVPAHQENRRSLS